MRNGLAGLASGEPGYQRRFSRGRILVRLNAEVQVLPGGGRGDARFQHTRLLEGQNSIANRLYAGRLIDKIALAGLQGCQSLLAIADEPVYQVFKFW